MADLDQDGKIFVGKSGKPEYLTLHYGNRHGLVTGATGTGKTVTLQVLAEGFARAGVSVFAADIKGDLSGIAAIGEAKDAFVKRAKELGFDYQPDEFPVDVLGCVRRAGPSGARHDLRNGSAAAGAADGSERRAGGRAQHRVSRSGRAGAAAARPEGPARDARLRRREREGADDDSTETSRRRPSAPSSARCWCWRTRAVTKFFGEPALDAEGFHDAPTATGAASSTSSPPTS